jgi:hypothetical protein
VRHIAPGQIRIHPRDGRLLLVGHWLGSPLPLRSRSVYLCPIERADCGSSSETHPSAPVRFDIPAGWRKAVGRRFVWSNVASRMRVFTGGDQ